MDRSSGQLKNLNKDPTPTPNVQITSDELVFPQQAVFDASGNMRASDNEERSNPSSRSASQSPTQLSNAGSSRRQSAGQLSVRRSTLDEIERRKLRILRHDL
jgi:hypothetical protein